MHNKIQKQLMKAYLNASKCIYIKDTELRLLDPITEMFGYLDDNEVIVQYYQIDEDFTSVLVEKTVEVPIDLEDVCDPEDPEVGQYMVDDDILNALQHVIVSTEGNPDMDVIKTLFCHIKEHKLTGFTLVED